METIGRRERKQAQTRVALAHALLARLDERALEDVSVRELAEDADISEATFFNYFPSKADLAIYVIQLWSIDAGERASSAAHRSARAAIEAVFDQVGAEIAAHPHQFAEIIAFQARMGEKRPLREVSRAERLLAFPDRPGTLEVDARGLDGILSRLIELAIARGELPRALDPMAALLALASVFFGVPLLLGGRAPQQVTAAYRQQLAIVWAGLSAPATP